MAIATHDDMWHVKRHKLSVVCVCVRIERMNVLLKCRNRFGDKREMRLFQIWWLCVCVHCAIECDFTVFDTNQHLIYIYIRLRISEKSYDIRMAKRVNQLDKCQTRYIW